MKNLCKDIYDTVSGDTVVADGRARDAFGDDWYDIKEALVPAIFPNSLEVLLSHRRWAFERR